MAYHPDNLSALSYANGFTLWHYKTPDAPAAIVAPGYFAPAASVLRKGDIILINASTDAAEVVSGTLSVVANRSGDVKVGPLASLFGVSAEWSPDATRHSAVRTRAFGLSQV